MTANATSFKPGTEWRGNAKGRPKRVHELRYLSIMHRLCPPETWAAITEKAIQQALEGDATARAWLSKYHLPEKIDQFAELDGDDSAT